MSAESICKRINKMNLALRKKIQHESVKNGSKTAQDAFNKSTEEDKADVVLITEDKVNTAFYVAGTTAMVAEFGAGSAVETSHPFSSDMEFPVKKGSYSDAHDGDYKKHNYEYWRHNHVKYTQVVPVRGMYLGMKDMRDNLQKVCDETTGWNK